MQPYCCPVCHGKCSVPAGFYDLSPFRNASSSSVSIPETCRSCFGRGIVWHGEDDTEGQPATILPPSPITFGGGVVTFREPLAMHSLTSLQGIIPANDPACSIEPPAITKEREERQSSIDPNYLHGGY